jgi:hypothetical protein
MTVSAASMTIELDDLANNQVIERHLNGCQMLFKRLLSARVLLDVSCDVHRRDRTQIGHMAFTPSQELRASTSVSFASIEITNLGCKKFAELASSIFAGIGEDRRNSVWMT